MLPIERARAHTPNAKHRQSRQADDQKIEYERKRKGDTEEKDNFKQLLLSPLVEERMRRVCISILSAFGY